MKRVCPSDAGSVMLLLAGLLACFPPWSGATEKLPEVSEVTRGLLNRSQAVARADEASHYIYEKRSLTESLNAAGQPRESEEKIYQVSLIAGFPFKRLLKIQGRELSSEELRKEERKEEAFRQKLTSTDAKQMASRREGWVTPELLDRYQFEVLKRVALSNRPTLVLTFKPKAVAIPAKTFRDKLLNRLEGTLWVDEAEADIARLSVHLTESISLGWFGWLGSLNRCESSLERQRMPDGVWVDAKQITFIQFRQVTAMTRLRFTEASSGFKKAQAKQ